MFYVYQVFVWCVSGVCLICIRCVFFGGLSPTDDPPRYMACVRDVWQFYDKHLPHLPLVINTMGWNKGSIISYKQVIMF